MPFANQKPRFLFRDCISCVSSHFLNPPLSSFALLLCQPPISYTMSIKQQSPIATSAALAPSLFQQVGMAGSAAVITVSFIHPIDVVKVRLTDCLCPDL